MRGIRSASARTGTMVTLVTALACWGCGDGAGGSDGSGSAQPAVVGPTAMAPAPSLETAGMGPGMGGSDAPPPDTGQADAQPPDTGQADARPPADTAQAGAPPPADTGSDGGDVPATFETMERIISQAPCLGAGCHNDEQNPLDLRVDAELHGRITARVSEACGGIPVVNPGNPAQSALIQLLKGPCGSTPRMPIGCVADGDGSCVPPDYIAALEQWIADGAPPQ